MLGGDVYCYLCSCQCICVRGAMLPLCMSMYWGSMLPLFMSMCMRWGSGGNCCLCSFPCVCVREVGVNVASVHRHMYVLRRVNVSRVHVHVLGRSMLPLVMSMCMCLGEGNVVAVHVASVHVNAHVLNADQCCLCSWPCVKGG